MTARVVAYVVALAAFGASFVMAVTGWGGVALAGFAGVAVIGTAIVMHSLYRAGY